MVHSYHPWDDAPALDRFLPERAGPWDLQGPIVAVTLAGMKMREVPRFLRWGRPVERPIANHPAAVFSTGAQRPPHTMSTFSIWRFTLRHESDVPVAIEFWRAAC